MKKTMTWAAFRGYLGYIWKEKKILYLFGVFFFPAFIAANFLQVYLPKMIIMELEERRSIAYMGLSVLGLILVLLLAILIREKMSSYLEYGNRHVAQKMQCDYSNKLLYVDYAYLENKEFLSMRNLAKERLFGGEIGSQERAMFSDFMKTLVTMIAVVGNIVLYVYYIGKLCWWLIPVFFIIQILGAVITMCFFRRNEGEYGQKTSDSWQKLDYVTRKTEDFSMAKDIRLYHMNAWLSGLIKEYLGERLFYKRKELTASFLGNVVYKVTMSIFWTVLLGVVLIQFWQQNIGVSDVIFYANMGPLLFNLASNDMPGECVRLFHLVIGYQRFQEFMDYGENTGRMEVPVHREPPAIVLEHVSFAYPYAKKEILRDISLRVEPGEKLAIVGVNGAGKTTLMKLICGLLHPTAGRILLNGVDMETMEAEERYAWFSCTFQDVQFLPLSIRENISQEIRETSLSGEAGRNQQKDNLSRLVQRALEKDDRIWRCLSAAGIKSEIEGLPEKLDTLLEKNMNENATDFSGGQRQKLILARALYRDAGAMILDEPTAALDALAENEIYERYAELVSGKTSFFVSHRLASTRFCDRILLLDGGRIAEQGTHERLLAEKGIYAKMFAMQSKYYQGGDEA